MEIYFTKVFNVFYPVFLVIEGEGSRPEAPSIKAIKISKPQ